MAANAVGVEKKCYICAKYKSKYDKSNYNSAP